MPVRTKLKEDILLIYSGSLRMRYLAGHCFQIAQGCRLGMAKDSKTDYSGLA
jgi:hypothetical protein